MIIGITAGSAQCQDDVGAAAKGAICSVLEDSLQRLTCFDKAFPKAATAMPTPGVESAPGPLDEGTDTLTAAPAWEITREKSALDDSNQVTAMLMPTKSSGTGVGRNELALILRCAENTTSVVLVTTMFMTEETASVTVRIGDTPATTSTWGRSTNYKAVGLWSGSTAIPFIRSLPNDARLVVRLQERDRLDAEFNLGNVGEVAAEIAKACHWSAATPGG